MHERIRRFSQTGFLGAEANLIQQKEEMRIILEDTMRYDGYIPQLDCGLHWSTEYFEEKKCFEFKITMYGVFVGKRKACEDAIVYYDGIIHSL